MKLIFGILPSDRYYPEHAPEESMDFILLAYAEGLVTQHELGGSKKTPARKRDYRSRETLELRTAHTLSEDALEDIYARLDKGKRPQLDMELSHFESDWDSCTHLDVEGVPAKVLLKVDDVGRLHAEVDLKGWPVEFGLELFKRRIGDPEQVRHVDLRLLQILVQLSPSLGKKLRIAIGSAKSALFHPAIDASLGCREPFSALGPQPHTQSNVARRELIIRALAKDTTMLNKDDVRLLFGKMLPDVVDPKSEMNNYAPAKDETVTKLLSRAQIDPIQAGYYLGREITHIALPVLLQRRNSERYQSLRDDLIDAGVDVPDEPLLERQ